MNADKLFARAVAALPKAVRKRLDGDAPLDWTALEDPDTAARLGEAVRAHGLLPDAVETLVNRLIGDIGIVPADLAAGAEGSGAAGAWIRTLAIEAEGESYRIRDDDRREIHTGIRAEALAGYAMLALELATAVHEAGERWIEAGERHRTAGEGASSLLALCAIRMCEHLQSHLEGVGRRRTTLGLARTLDHAWNTQSLKTRAALSAIRLRVGRGTRAPRRSYYAPIAGYRLHSFDPGEIRWLLTLASQAATAVGTEKQEEKSPAAVAKPTAVERAAKTDDAATGDIYALEARIRAANEETGTLQLGSYPEELVPDRELADLMRTAKRVSDAVRRRMRESYGIGFTQALSRLRSADDAAAVGSEIKAAMAQSTLPRWLEELATTLLTDTGAQTRDGTRTSSIGLHAEEEADAGYRAIETETGAVGRLAPLGLVEQVRLSLAFALDAWRGHAALRSAGKESGWILDKGEAEGSRFSEDERETLEAARRMEQVLDRIQRAHGKETPTALEEASMTADAFRGVGPTTRIAAGWPDTAEVPDARNPADVARIATVVEALHEEIRSIANKFIATWVAGANAYGKAGNDHAAPQRQDGVPPKDGVAGKRHHAGPGW